MSKTDADFYFLDYGAGEFLRWSKIEKGILNGGPIQSCVSFFSFLSSLFFLFSLLFVCFALPYDTSGNF